jgi:hypothetical protein
MILAALLVVAGVWTWLPPDDATQAATTTALARFETAKWLLWPDDHYGATTLPAKVRDDLEERRHRELMTLAEGAALEDALEVDAVAALLRAPHLDGGRVPVARRADIVYYDFRRRTPRGELKVRAAYDVIVTTGTWDPRAGAIVDEVEDEPSDWCQLYDYTLRQYGDAWRVVAKEAVSGPNGGPPYYYSPSTGEFTQDTGA